MATATADQRVIAPSAAGATAGDSVQVLDTAIGISFGSVIGR